MAACAGLEDPRRSAPQPRQKSAITTEAKAAIEDLFVFVPAWAVAVEACSVTGALLHFSEPYETPDLA